MVLPLIAGGALLGSGWLFGKSSGGGVDLNTEFFTKKEYKSTQDTYSSQTTYAPTYAPTTTRVFDISYNIASEGSTISTKKEQQVTQTPTISPTTIPQIIQIPTTTQGGNTGGSASGSGSSFDFVTPLIIAGFVAGGYYLLKKNKKKK